MRIPDSVENFRPRQFCPMEELHIGEFVKKILVDRHINRSSLAKAMGVKQPAVEGYLRAVTIKDDTLMRMSKALKFDLYGMVQEEKAKRLPKELPGDSEVNEPAVKYQARGPEGGSGVTILLHMEEYDEDTALRIYKFLQLQKKKAK